MSDALSLCVNTQTPLVQFLGSPALGRRTRWTGRPTDLGTCKEGTDFQLSPGGVTRMVFPLVRRLHDEGVLRETHWVSLNPRGPRTAYYQGLTLHNISMAPSRLTGYGAVKEGIWRVAHGLGSGNPPEEMLWTPDFSEYAYYNRATAELLRRLDRAHDFDLFYIHDFQQMPVGRMLGRVKPKIFRWHIPFEDTMVPSEWRATFNDYLEHYDTVVVSTERYLKALRSFGFSGRARKSYPYVDPAEYGHPSPAVVETCCAKWGIRPEDDVMLVVARMDPAKGQDHALRALASIAKRAPQLRLVLVGNGSFSGSSTGLGLSKSSSWRGRLEALVRKLGLEGRAIFTGHVTQHELDCLYERCDFTVLPSAKEGFGLVVVESWLHGKPSLVSEEAGVTELIRSGENGEVFDPIDEEALASRMERLALEPERRQRMGAEGLRTSRLCTLAVAAKEEASLMAEVVEA